VDKNQIKILFKNNGLKKPLFFYYRYGEISKKSIAFGIQSGVRWNKVVKSGGF